MRSIFQYIEAIARSTQPVLITGESGVGKELVAKVVHDLSGRQGEFIPVNVAGLDDNIFADTLFGHKKGAFTGADRARPGLVENARAGTLFLDEIGDLPQASQVKLLRLVQEREYMPIGSDVTRKTDARIIAATNADPAVLGEPERFRSDLYYRLRAHHVHLPPLRQRREDIPLLVDHFLRQACQQRRKPTPPPELFPLLLNYAFPGNIRELQFLVLDAVSCTNGDVLDIERIRRHVAAHRSDAPAALPGEGPVVQFGAELPTLKGVCAELVLEAMRRTGGNQAMAAGMLGVSRQALNKRLNKMLLASEDEE
jgi:DNA-binding NtrC family response regulator